jgi:AcrR family transcriptional regulator
MNSTQIKVLEAAETEFAEFGFAGASIRNITQRAGVNIASVNYHFGSKEALIRQLLEHRIAPLNKLRIERLHEAQVRYPDQVVPLNELVDILVRPLIEKLITEEGGQFVRAMARCMSEPLEFLQEVDREVFHEIFLEFSQAFTSALPHLGREAVVHQLHFVICSMVGMMMHFPRLETLGPSRPSKKQFDQLLDDFIHFITSGIEGARSA